LDGQRPSPALKIARRLPVNTIPLFDPAHVLKTLNVIRAEGQVIEVRVLEGLIGGGNWPATYSGYFNDPAKVVEALRALRTATGIYTTVNHRLNRCYRCHKREPVGCWLACDSERTETN
jgi:hypothetical protein